MKLRSAFAAVIVTLACSPFAMAATVATSAKVGAQPGSNQYITILNLLGDVTTPETINKSDVNITYYDSKLPFGTKGCWTTNNPILFNQDPLTAGSGSDNTCYFDTDPKVGGISAIDIIPLNKDKYGTPIYQVLTNVKIDDPSNYFTAIVIKQNKPPVWDATNTQIIYPGTITVERYLKSSQPTKN